MRLEYAIGWRDVRRRDRAGARGAGWPGRGAERSRPCLGGEPSGL